MKTEARRRSGHSISPASLRPLQPGEQARRLVALGGAVLAERPVIVAEFKQGELCGTRRRPRPAQRRQFAPEMAAAVDADEAGQGSTPMRRPNKGNPDFLLSCFLSFSPIANAAASVPDAAKLGKGAVLSSRLLRSDEQAWSASGAMPTGRARCSNAGSARTRRRGCHQ